MNISSGLGIDHDLLKLQSETRDDSFVFFQMKYAERKCIFLDRQLPAAFMNPDHLSVEQMLFWVMLYNATQLI